MTQDKNRDVADDHKKSGDPTKHEPGKPNEHVSKNVYLMPESYNALRKELEHFYPTLWHGVQYYMAFDAPVFCNIMDEALDLITQFDSGNVDGICKRYLDELRSKRGVSRLHNPSEYYANTAMEAEIREARKEEEVAPWLKPKGETNGNGTKH